jgi:hypothetical protein
MLRLLAMSDRDKDVEILALRHQITMLQRQPGRKKVRFAPPDRALLTTLCREAATLVRGRTYGTGGQRVEGALRGLGCHETPPIKAVRLSQVAHTRPKRTYHEGVDLDGPAIARIAKDHGYTLAELRKLSDDDQMSTALRAEFFFDDEANTWHYRVPALHINGDGTSTREDAQRECLDAIALEGDPSEYDSDTQAIALEVSVVPAPDRRRLRSGHCSGSTAMSRSRSPSGASK